MFILQSRLCTCIRSYYLVQFRSNFTTTMTKNADNRFDTFRQVCDEIAAESSYLNKAKVLRGFFQNGIDRSGFQGDTLLWVQMLIPAASQRVYNLQNKQMIKLFSRLFGADQQNMHHDLEQDGDISETLCKYFEDSQILKPKSESTLYLHEVDDFLLELEQRTKEDEQSELLRGFCKQATELDLKMVVRLIKQDLRINARARHILDAFGADAYPAYQSSRDLSAVVAQFANNLSKVNGKIDKAANSVKATKKGNKAGQVQVMTPISPMLANACKSIDEALKKCPIGMYSEVKYDGERVQIHKRNSEFKFFSRNLKPVMEHKIKRFKEFIPKAFPAGGDMILDSEIILVDTITGDLLPFGTLGSHKKKEFDKAEVCLFVFDCVLFNGEDLTKLELRERRKILENNIKPIKNYVQLSESKFLKTKTELSVMTAKVLKANLEGVVLKNPHGTYQPGKRGWLKIKKDYLFGGKMADTADLVVLGAWFGSGKKGGILSIFLMGCYDRRDRLWKTVTKVHSGLDDATNEEIHEQLLPLMQRADANGLPNWLLCNRPLVPDYIAKNPKEMPVWEITGAEFTKSEAHTAAGISIRFPRITKLRDDKSAEQANDLKYLQQLYDTSKNHVNVDLLMTNCDTEIADDESTEIVNKLSTTPNKRIKVEDDDEPSSSKKLKRKLSDDKQLASNKNTTEDKKVKVELNVDRKKQTKLNFAVNKTTSTAESGIFKGIVAYFDASVCNAASMREFASNGGTLTKDKTKATVVIYKSTQVPVTLETCRQEYRRSCRHLSVEWLQDSLKAKKCVPQSLYSLVLR